MKKIKRRRRGRAPRRQADDTKGVAAEMVIGINDDGKIVMGYQIKGSEEVVEFPLHMDPRQAEKASEMLAIMAAALAHATDKTTVKMQSVVIEQGQPTSLEAILAQFHGFEVLSDQDLDTFMRVYKSTCAQAVFRAVPMDQAMHMCALTHLANMIAIWDHHSGGGVRDERSIRRLMREGARMSEAPSSMH